MATPQQTKKGKTTPGEKNDAQPKRGRPSTFTDELADEICRRLYESEGEQLPESLRAICRDPAMPHIDTVMVWIKEKPSFSERYARARELRKGALVDRLLWLAEEAKRHATGAPGTGEAGAKVSAFKLEIDAIKWIRGKDYARDYGDKVSQEITGKMETKTTVEISEELQEQILAKTAEASAIASAVQPPASFRGEGREE